MVVRVRFAPSPTGFLHIGNVRTALINWLFARASGGRFILRIEDTDKENCRKEYEEAIIQDLRWLGIDWDEGPDVGGDFAPYRQSERFDRYKAALKDLYERSLVYPCFCTKERLEELRLAQKAAGKQPRYDNKCRSIPKEEAQRRIEAGEPHVWRFKLDESRTVEFDDLVRGKVAIPASSLGGDPVIVRSNGTPLFIFAGAVDDVAMQITHVLRGEDHLSNTARQIEIIRALGGNPPVFGHLPLVLAPGGKPLSKREGSTGIAELRKRGILPSALVNYLALLGFSPPQGSGEVFLPEELIKIFDASRIGSASAVYDEKRLLFFCAEHIKRLSAQQLLDAAKNFIEPEVANALNDMPQTLRTELLESVKQEIHTLQELNGSLKAFFAEPEPDEKALEAIHSAGADFFETVIDTVKSASSAQSAIDEISKKTGKRGAKLFKPLRAALTGKVSGPPVVDLLKFIPKQSLFSRFEKAIVIAQKETE